MNPDNKSAVRDGEAIPADSAQQSRLRQIVHDLRNVVAPLSNASQLLSIRSRTDAQLVPVVEILQRQVAQMVLMLDELAGMAGSELTAGAPAVDAAASARPRRVLIADDNAALLTSLSSVLRETGHTVRTAQNGREAVALAAQWRPEFVLLDAALPQMNGFEVARQLRGTFARDAMTLVLMSGAMLDEAARRGAERAGFDRCIDKIQGIEALEALLKSG